MFSVFPAPDSPLEYTVRDTNIASELLLHEMKPHMQVYGEWLQKAGVEEADYVRIVTQRRTKI